MFFRALDRFLFPNDDTRCTSCQEEIVQTDDYKFLEMIEQKPLIAISSLSLIGHPYIALER